MYDMGLYHGTSDAEWESKLQDASARAAGGGGGGTGTAAGARGLAVGLAVSGLKYAWENTTASVEARFAAMARAVIAVCFLGAGAAVLCLLVVSAISQTLGSVNGA